MALIGHQDAESGEARYNMGTPKKVQRSQMWYAGVVKNVQGMKYDVKHDDGSFEQGIPAEYVRRVEMTCFRV